MAERDGIQRIGSQVREKLHTTGYRLAARRRGEILLEPPDYPSSPREIWYLNTHHAGYTIFVGRAGYEYGRDSRTGGW